MQVRFPFRFYNDCKMKDLVLYDPLLEIFVHVYQVFNYSIVLGSEDIDLV